MDNVAALPELVSRPDPVQQDDTVLVSIVMPAFNAEAYIGAAIASAQAQSEARRRCDRAEPGRVPLA